MRPPSDVLVLWRCPFTTEEGSGAPPLLELFFPPEILGNMNIHNCGFRVLTLGHCVCVCVRTTIPLLRTHIMVSTSPQYVVMRSEMSQSAILIAF